MIQKPVSTLEEFDENISHLIPEINLKKSISQPAKSIEVFKPDNLPIKIKFEKLKKSNPRYFDTNLHMLEKEEFVGKYVFSEGSSQTPNISEKENATNSKKSTTEKKKKRLNPAAKKFEGEFNFNYMNNSSISIGESLSVSSSNRKLSYGEDTNQFLKYNISKYKQSDYEKNINREDILSECLDNLEFWCKDKYNNFIIQKILETGVEDHKRKIFVNLKSILIELQNDKFGCRVFQKCLEAFPNPKEHEYQYMFQMIKKNVREMIQHENGNFVIQRCFEVYKGESLKYLLQIIQQDLTNICIKKYGCIVINKLIELYPKKCITDSENSKLILEIIESILKDGYKLSITEFSNYIIQHIIEKGTDDHKKKILDEVVKKDFVSLSENQYASNVTEKAIIYSNSDYRMEIWKKLVARDASNKPANFLKLVNNSFGNYVMQRLYEYFGADLKKEFNNLLESNTNDLSDQSQRDSFHRKPAYKDSSEKPYSQFVINFTHKHSNI